MNPIQVTLIALRALRRNKVRSLLTALGIIIGVGAVISMVAIGEGAKARVIDSFSSMGTNLLILMSGSSKVKGVHGGFGSVPTLTWDDLSAIRDEVGMVYRAAPNLRSSATIVSESLNWTTSLTGTSPDLFDIRSWKTASGALFTQSDIDAKNKVVVLGQTVVDNLFGESSDPTGQFVRINGMPFQVIGVLAKKGQSAMGQDNDDGAFIPYTTFQSKISNSDLGQFIPGAVMISVSSADAVQDTIDAITSLLRQRHHLKEGKDDDFSIRNLTEMADAMEEGTKTMTMLLAGIAAVSLLVGGIGIMNIMLVSVTERTREIGLRMAVGATPNHILAQFLVEAVVLSFVGGIIGIIAGILVAQRLSSAFGWPLLISPGIIFLAFGFSALVGVGFGLYPAHKASRLNPIESLHYE